MSGAAKGVKHDAGKVRPSLVIGGFSQALLAVADVATFGARKYTADGWRTVPDAIQRYTDAKDRHRLAGEVEEADPESGLAHAAHEAWNALAVLELRIAARKAMPKNDQQATETPC
jgi:hypothetical protein